MEGGTKGLGYGIAGAGGGVGEKLKGRRQGQGLDDRDKEVSDRVLRRSPETKPMRRGRLGSGLLGQEI